MASVPRGALNPPANYPLDCIVIHTDAAWHSERSLAGLGWIIDTGINSRSYMAHCFFVNSALVAEALALREALATCIDKGIRRVHFKSDSLQLIKAINSSSSYPEVYGVVADILSLSLAFECIYFSWIQRGNNKEADALAKQALLNEPFVSTSFDIGA